MIDVNPNHLDTVTRILARHVPECEVSAFGSRVTWTAKDYSDLDLAVVGERALDLDALRRLKEAFEESDLPFRVDVLDWHAINSAFRKVIEKKYEVLQKGKRKSLGMAEYDAVTFKELFAAPLRNGLTRPKAVRGQGVKMVNMGELFAHDRIRAVPMDRVPIDERERGSYLLEPGDLLFARQSLVLAGAGKCSILLEADEPVTFESHIIRARLNNKTADPLFYFYFFGSRAGRNVIESIVEQVAAAGIRGSDLANLEVPKPPLPEQRAIAQILGTLDDKIELNRRMNKTLEAMARALFKSWFVDFDPVRAKAEGRDPGLPQPLADLFPDSFEDSELGEVPKGWEPGKLGDVLAELVSGARPKGGAVEEGVPSIGAENVIGLGRYDFSKEKYVPAEFFEQLKLKGAALRPGDVLLYKDGAQIGRKTYFDRGFPHVECAVNEHVFILRAKRPEAQRYLFFWLDQHWMTQEIISLNSNSAQPGINQPGVRGLSLLIPRKEVIAAFDRLARRLTARLFANCNESRTLAALRDTLLPKLISGEIRVKDAAEHMEATL